MSLKSGVGKFLKGVAPAGTAGSIDMNALLAALSTANVSLTNVSLQNIIAWGGLMDDVAIGSLMPNTAVFTSVTVGMDQKESGGRFVVYGNKGSVNQYDQNGNVISTTPGDSMSWDPVTATLSISGALHVRDPVQFGNIIIRDNEIVAMQPTDGNVEIYPQSNKGYIKLGGNVQQNLVGSVHFDQATEFSTDSRNTSTVNSKNDNVISTERGDISLVTDSKALVNIASLSHHLTTTAQTVTTTSGLTTQVDTVQIIVGATYMQTTETTLQNQVKVLVIQTTKTKTTVDGQPATTTTTVTTFITPATPISPEKIQTGTTTTTTLDSLVPNDFVPLTENVVDSVRQGVVTTPGRHGLDVGDEIVLYGTNVFDGAHTVEEIADDYTFSLPCDAYFETSYQGYFTLAKTGSINISAAKQVRFETAVPLLFGTDDLTYRPYIVANTQDDLTMTANYLHTFDPIPTLHSPSDNFSDSGIAVQYTENGLVNQAFFGFVTSTQNFTWIPQATITRFDDGTKRVSGERGVMELKGIQLNQIVGNPDIDISTPQGSIFLDAATSVNVSPTLNIGTAGSLGQSGDGTDLIVSSANGNVVLSPGPDGAVQIPSGIPLSFSASTSIVGVPDGALQVTSANGPVLFESDVSVPVGKVVRLGNADLTTTSTDLEISNVDTLSLSPNTAIAIPDDVLLQIGSLGQTGLVGHQGTLKGTSVGDMLFASGGNASWSTQGVLSLTVAGGVTNLNSTHLVLPNQAELNWGVNSGTYISTIPDGTLKIHSDQPTSLTSPSIDLNASTSVNLPSDVPLNFGASGAKIFAQSDDGLLYVSNPNGVVVDKDLVVSGSLTVYGPTSEITSTTTVLEDPILTLGSSAVPEYLKDRGIQFYYGNGKLGFIGYGQDTHRFYLIEDGVNNDEVFDKSNFGDLQVGKLYVDGVSSAGAMTTNEIYGNPHLNLDASYIGLTAQQYIIVPDSIPLQFSGSNNSIYGSGDSLHLDSPMVNVSQGTMTVGTSTGSIAVGTTSGILTLGGVSLSVNDAAEATLSGAQTINLDGSVNVPSDVNIGLASLVTDASGNITISAGSPGGVVNLASSVNLSNSGFDLGDARLYWDSTDASLHLVSPRFSMQTDVVDARWMGQTVETLYGGTGRNGDWHEKCVVFVGPSGTILDEDPIGGFVYDKATASLSLRTADFPDAFAIGRGGVDLMDDGGNVFFRTSGTRSWSAGKSTTIPGCFSISSLSSSDATASTRLVVNPYGQIGFGGGAALESLFSGLTGAEKDRFFVFGSGDIYFVDPVSAVRWGAETYVKSDSNLNLTLASPDNTLSLDGVTGISGTTTKSISWSAQSNMTVDVADQYLLNASSISLSTGDLGNYTVTGANGYLRADALLSLTAPTVTLSSDKFGLTGGTFTISVDDYVLTSANNVSIHSALDCNLNVGGSMQIESASWSVVNQNLLSMISTDVDISSSNRFSLSTVGYVSDVTGDAAFTVGGTYDGTIVGTGHLSVDQFTLSSSSTLSIAATQRIQASSAEISLSSTASFTVQAAAAASIHCDDSLSITATKALDVTTQDVLSLSGNSLSAVAVNAMDVSSGTTFALTTGDSSSLRFGSDVTQHSVGTFTVSTDAACAIFTGTDFTVNADNGIGMVATNAYSIQCGLPGYNLSSGGTLALIGTKDVQMVSLAGNVSLSSNVGDVTSTAGGAIRGQATTDLVLGTQTGTIALNSGKDIALACSGNCSLNSAGTYGVVVGTDVNFNSATFTVSASSIVKFLTPQVFTTSTVSFAETTTSIKGTLGGLMTIASNNEIKLVSPHVIVPNRLCLHHDPISDVCTTYEQWNPTTTDLDIVNDIGGVNLRVLSHVTLPDSVRLQFGSAGYIGGVGPNLFVSTTTGDISLLPGSGTINLPTNVALNFGTETAVSQSANGFVVNSTAPVSFRVPSIFVPDRTPLIFGDPSRHIVSDGSALFVTSSDLISLEAPTVRVVGNLIVTKTSTVTIETETNFDSGVIILGGGEIRHVVDLSPATSTTTLVTLDIDHHLFPGDPVTVVDSIPNVDGAYVVLETPASNQFTVDVVYPTDQLPSGQTASGTVRTPLTSNPGIDEGVQFNWNTGETNDTTSARTGFFGFRRSTRRFVYIPEATRLNDDSYSGQAGDVEVNTLYSNSISASDIISPINVGANAIRGSNFLISGGSLDHTPIGANAPSTGVFTNLSVSGMSIGSSDVVSNLNADMVDGYHAGAFVFRDGSASLTADWYAGAFRITTTGLSDLTLVEGGCVFSGAEGMLRTSVDFTFANGVLSVARIAGFQLDGDIVANNHNIASAVLTQSTITSSQFSGGTVDSSQFTNGSVVNSTVTDSTVTQTNVTDSTVTQTNVTNSRISQSTVDSSAVTNGNLVTGTMQGYSITDSTIDHGTITGTALSASQFDDGTLSNVTMDSSAITNGTMTGTTVSASTFSNVDVSGSRIADTTLTHVTIGGSEFTSGTVESSAFVTGTIDTSTMKNSSISSSTADSISVSNGTLTSSSFANGSITDSSLDRVTGTNVTLSGSTIDNSYIKNSTLTSSDFSGGTVTGTAISGGTMVQTSLTNVGVDSSTFANGTVQSSSIDGGTTTDLSQSGSVIVRSSFNDGTMDNNTIANTIFSNGDVLNSYVNNGTIAQSTFDAGKVTASDVSLSAGNVLDVSNGTVVFANDQIAGDWISGGTADVDISGNAATVSDGMYRRDFAQDNSMLKADVAGNPYSFEIAEDSLVGRKAGAEVQSMDVPTAQDMLDIVAKKTYADNSILKADVASQPLALSVPEDTLVGRTVGDVIAALTPEQVVEMVMTREVLHRYGAVLRDGHRTFPDGGLMTGLLYPSWERFSLSTGQTRDLDLNVETSYVSVNYSRAGGRLARLTLGNGFQDGHRKVIILSRLVDPALLQVFADFVAPETIDPSAFVFRYAGHSAVLQWDTVLAKWVIVGSGCDVMTRDELRNPNWMDVE